MNMTSVSNCRPQEEILFSIIISTFNAFSCLEKAILSVLDQNFDGSYELIIIDGASTDQTQEIINKYSEFIAYSVSESDHGIYDAWNKGISVARGEWISFLGADDYLLPHSLTLFADFILNSPGFDYISARVCLRSANGRSRTIGMPWEWLKFKHFMGTAHVASMHSSSLFKKYGTFSLKYSICADYEFFIRIGPALKAGYINQVVATMQAGGLSQSSLQPIVQTKKIKIEAKVVSRLRANWDFVLAVIKWMIRHFMDPNFFAK